MLRKGLFFGFLLAGSLEAAIISSLSEEMGVAVISINYAVSSNFSEFKGKMGEIKNISNDNKLKYNKRKKNIELLNKKNKEIQVYMQVLQFEYSKNKDIEKLRKKDLPNEFFGNLNVK